MLIVSTYGPETLYKCRAATLCFGVWRLDREGHKAAGAEPSRNPARLPSAPQRRAAGKRSGPHYAFVARREGVAARRTMKCQCLFLSRAAGRRSGPDGIAPTTRMRRGAAGRDPARRFTVFGDSLLVLLDRRRRGGQASSGGQAVKLLAAPWLLLLDRRRRRYEVGLECQRWWCRVIPNSDIATGIYIATRIHIATRIYLATRISRLGYRDSISRISLQTDLRFSAPEDSTALQGRGHSLCRRPCQADSSDFAANKTCSAAAWPSTGFRLGSRQRIKHGVKPGHQKGDGLAGQRIKHGVKLSINGARAPPLSHGADDGEEPAKR